MELNADLQFLLSSSFRILFLNMVSACHVTWINQKFLPMKKSPALILLFFFIRTLVLYIGFQLILEPVYGNSRWFRTAFNSTTLLFIIVMYFMMNAVYEGEFLKIFLSSCATEIITVFPFNLALATVNYLDGYQEPLYIYGTFQAWDLLFPVILFPITCLMGILIFPYIKRFRTWEIKHRKLMWTIFIGYGIIATSTYLFNKENLIGGCALILSVYLLVFIVVIAIMRSSQQKIQTQKNYFRTRQRLVESYLSDILKQTERMDNCRKVINTQMEEITQMENLPSNSRKIRSYLAELQQAYEQIRAGIYCDNWLIDSALCYEQKIMAKEMIPFSCNLQEYQDDLIPEEEAVQLLLLFLDWGIENVRKLTDEKNRFIRLRIYPVKNLLFFQLETASEKKHRLHKNTFRQYLKKYSGNIRQEKLDGYVQTTISLSCSTI